MEKSGERPTFNRELKMDDDDIQQFNIFNMKYASFMTVQKVLFSKIQMHSTIYITVSI